MTIPSLAPIPLRNEQADKLTSLQHDAIHMLLWNGLQETISVVNALILAGGGALPVGTSLTYTVSTTLPAGFLWEDGSTVSKTTYLALWNLFSLNNTQPSPWDEGNEPAGTFRLPKPQGRVPMCANPLNSISAGSPSLSTRLLGAKVGAETYANSALPVTGNTPITTISFSSMGAVTFPTFTPGTLAVYSAGTQPSYNAGVQPSYVQGVQPIYAAGTWPSYTPGTLSSSTGGALSSLAAAGGFISSQNKTGVGVNGVVCTDVMGGEPPISVIACGTLTVADFTVDITAANIFSALNFSAGSFPTFDPGTLPVYSAGVQPSLTPGTNPIYTAGTWPSYSAGTWPSYTPGTLPSSTGGSANVTGAAATSPATALSGVTASITATIIQPSLVYSRIIKF